MKIESKNPPNDIEIAMAAVNKINPAIEGLTLNQIELCFEFVLKNIRNGVPIKFRE